MHPSDGGSRQIAVRDVMTPRTQLDAFPAQRHVGHAKVGQLIASRERLGRQHTLVVEARTPTLASTSCAAVSTSHIARRLGVPLHLFTCAERFAKFGAR